MLRNKNYVKCVKNLYFGFENRSNFSKIVCSIFKVTYVWSENYRIFAV